MDDIVSFVGIVNNGPFSSDLKRQPYTSDTRSGDYNYHIGFHSEYPQRDPAHFDLHLENFVFLTNYISGIQWNAFSLTHSYDVTLKYQVIATGDELPGDPVAISVLQTDQTGTSTIAPQWFVNGMELREGSVPARIGDTITIRMTGAITANLSELLQRIYPVSAWGTPTMPNYVHSIFSVTTETVASDPGVYIDAARFAGPDTTPSSQIDFDWSSWAGTEFSGTETFTVGLWYSSDRVFDDGDVWAGALQDVVVDNVIDSGTSSFTFGSKPLLPNKVRPYVLVVIERAFDPDAAGRSTYLVLPFLNIQSIEAEEPGKRKGEWLSTLLHESTFNLERSPLLDDNELTIEARRTGILRPGQSDEWLPFAMANGTRASGRHRQPGLFEYRVVVDIDGNTFTSEIYSGTKKATPLPRVDVRFPHVNEIRQSELFTSDSLEYGASDLWNRTLDTFSDTYNPLERTATAREIAAYVFLDTSNGEYFMHDIRVGDPMQAVYKRGLFSSPKVVFEVDLAPVPSDVEFDDGTGMYCVAHFHTHPAIIGAEMSSGASPADIKVFRELNRIIQMPGFAYTHVGRFTKKGGVIDEALFPALPADLYSQPALPFDFNVKRRVGYLPNP